HRLILAETLTRLPKQFGEAAIGAVAFTSAPFEQVIGWSQGPAEAEVFHTRLENDFASIDQALWWSIESRLGLEPEQAVKLSEAMGVPSVAGGAPIITSLRADSPRLIPGESYLLTCMASDMEDDELSFQWLSTEGTLEADGQSTAVWTAPDETGVYLVTVVVSDDNGNQTNKDIRLVVGETDEDEQDADAGPFSVDGLILEGNLCSEQTWAAEDWLVFQGREVSATCLIDGDAEGLEYEWRCVRLTKVVATDFEETGGDPGTLTGSGQSVTWEAFQGGGYARISVSVSNGNGLVKEESTVIRVTTCASCIN
ncbi:MAG: hypothetical protein JW846_05460, partial [Dehalococcoidia bacterium]|nr:hypothetical protein [Dehalococcoidia bacterium]